MNLSELRKALTAASGCVGVIAAQYATNGDVQHWTTIALAVLSAVGTWAVPNTPAGKHEVP